MPVHRGHPERHHDRHHDSGADPPRPQDARFAPSPDDMAAQMRTDQNEGSPCDDRNPGDHEVHPPAEDSKAWRAGQWTACTVAPPPSFGPGTPVADAEGVPGGSTAGVGLAATQVPTTLCLWARSRSTESSEP